MNNSFNDGFDDEGVFIGHEDIEIENLRNELNAFIRAGQKIIKAGDAMASKLVQCDELQEWKQLRKLMKLPGESN